MEYSVTLVQPVSLEMIANTMCAGVEGGITQWCWSFKPVRGTWSKERDDQDDREPWYVQPAFWESDFLVKVKESEFSYESNPEGTWEFGPEDLQRALHTLANGGWESAEGWKALETGRKHLQNMLEENEDADTGDVLIQLCVFGEVVYG